MKSCYDNTFLSTSLAFCIIVARAMRFQQHLLSDNVFPQSEKTLIWKELNDFNFQNSSFF